MIKVKNKKIVRIILATMFILLLPLVAMQFTDEVSWSPVDFVVGGTLLIGAGLIYEQIARKMNNITYRSAVGLSVLTALMLVWVNLAVGIIGSEENPANLMYSGVLVVMIIGAFVTRLRPYGMAWVLFVTAIAQLLVGFIALIAGLDHKLILDAFFALLWVGSALLFRKSSVTNTK